MVDQAASAGFAVDARYPAHLRDVLGQLGPRIKSSTRRLFGADEVETLLDSKADPWSGG